MKHWSPECRFGYTPIDVTLSRPDIRILRAARHFDSLAANDLFDLLDVPRLSEDEHERNRFYKALSRLVQAGHLERLAYGVGPTRLQTLDRNWYRVTPAGRAELERRLAADTRTIFSPIPEERNRAA